MNPPITIQARTNNLDKCELLASLAVTASPSP
jgi:hypothetical protein